MATAKEKTFVEKVLNFINGGEEATVKAVQKSALKQWKRQVELKTLKIEDIERRTRYEIGEQKEFLEGAKGELEEAYLNINGTVKGKREIDAYIDAYKHQIANAKANVDNFKDAIKKLETDSAAAIEKLKKEISFIEDDIKAISK